MATPTCRLITHFLPGNVVDSSCDTTCLICTDHFKSQLQSLFRLFGCHHIFHEKCITLWLSKHNTCPMCRRVMQIPYLRMINLPLPHGFRLPSHPPDTMRLQVPEQQSDDHDGTSYLCLNFHILPESMKYENHLSQSEMEYLDRIFSSAGYPDDEMRHDLLALACAPFSVVSGVCFVD
ncbi:hypothetical protein LXL04_029293 [Taraxacum kok-saghyz]